MTEHQRQRRRSRPQPCLEEAHKAPRVSRPQPSRPHSPVAIPPQDRARNVASDSRARSASPTPPLTPTVASTTETTLQSVKCDSRTVTDRNTRPIVGSREAPWKIVVLGDESSSDKLKLLDTLRGITASDVSARTNSPGFPPIRALHEAPVIVTHLSACQRGDGRENDESSNQDIFEVWFPRPSSDLSFDFVTSTFPNTHAFLLAFSITEPSSLRALQTVWETDVRRYWSTTHGNPLVFVVAMNAEARTGHTSRTPPLVSIDEAVSTARACNASRYIEVLSASSSHTEQVFRQVLKQISSQGREQASAAYDCAARERMLARFTLDDPRGHFDLLRREFQIDSSKDVATFYAISDAVTMNPQECILKYSGPVRSSDLKGHAYIAVISVLRGRYISRIVNFEIPEEIC